MLQLPSLQRQPNGDILLTAEAAQFLIGELHTLEDLLGREQGLRIEEVGRMETVQETAYRQDFVDKLSATVGIKADAVQAAPMPSTTRAVDHKAPLEKIASLREWLEAEPREARDEAAESFDLQHPSQPAHDTASFATFIRQEIDAIVDSWSEFARGQIPPARNLSPRDLQDHAKVLLLSIADDIESEQTDAEQRAKSRGERPGNAPAVTRSARDHAQHRFEQGFTLNEMVAEYRALRASVQRLWATGEQPRGLSPALQLLRFNEAMDQGLSESIACFSQQLEVSRDLLLAVLGHDLRNPLGAVMGSAQFLIRTEQLDGKQLKAVARILNSAHRMSELIKILLDFTRVRLGMELPLAPVHGNLGTVCQSVIEELRAFHPDRDLQLQCAGDLEGEWDLQRIGQLTSNLVSNALQHGTRHAPVRVTVDAEETQAAMISVHNEGPAMAEQVRKTLFEPLQRVLPEAGGAHEGSSGLGLGLYIAHQIAQAHGGDIAVESAEGQGTTFTVHLPKQAPARPVSRLET